MKNQAQLIAYVDRLSGGTFHDLQRLLDGPLAGAFGGVHVLPFFHPIDGADAGFDPIDHTQVDPRLGTWDDVATLAEHVDVMADVIVNHISRHSPQFRRLGPRRRRLSVRGHVPDVSRVFPQGARESDLLAFSGPRPALPFTTAHERARRAALLWTTFTSDQIDIDVPRSRRDAVPDRHPHATPGRQVRAIRLDAVGYAIKKAGTSCFMIPETCALIDDITAQAHRLGWTCWWKCTGTTGHRSTSHGKSTGCTTSRCRRSCCTRSTRATPRRCDDGWRYVRTTRSRCSTRTTALASPTSARTGDSRTPGLLAQEAIDALIETIHARSRDESRLASGGAARNVDAFQINCTFYDALGRRDDEYLVARAIQCFVPGIPQIYYVGLLAGTNDLDLLHRTGEGRDINRHYYTPGELQRALAQPVVQSLVSLLRIRNTHAAFQGRFHLETADAGRLVLVWTNGAAFARLEVDLAEMQAAVTCSVDGAGATALVWCSRNGAIQGEDR